MISLNLFPSSSSLNPGLLRTTRARQDPTRQSPLLATGNKPVNGDYPLGFSPIPKLRFRGFAAKPLFSIANPEYSSGFSRRFRSIAAVPPPAESAAGSSEPSPDGEYEISAEETDGKTKSKTLQLAIVFGFWYFQNIVFNIFNKKALNVFPFPWLLASFQLFTGSVWMLVLWSLKLYPCPKISKSFIIALLGPALFHTIGHISACVSFSKVAVSFTHVIKSAEPVFSVIFSSFLGDPYPLSVWLSILPIVFGVSLAAITEVSFNLGGLWGAMISNVGFVLRNIYSKRSLQNFKEIDGLNLYGWISIVSLLYLFPVAIFIEGSQWVQGYHKAIEAVGKPATFYMWVLLSGIFYHLYNQSSYQALDQISPLTFSVGNTMKRVVVIVSSVLVFRNPVRPLNALGSAIAILGTFLYSQATAKKVKTGGGDKKN
ncbi:PREDICTED: xylulose 5-phosphate/phosphate translocator, chloroplastic [Tarenaya hassleriana]|uniref:xylulose 5-phosphate/phosphate translocator, chloroplastic n=1 Tax=Tarenaya hassleriana TaxID=28532 RepID=UPI00053C1D0C|nr:PREDICTED: xylulose 5-phosphate/phosphate translocator, chloroplastic [Tarenaya hassleriana]